MEKKKKLKLEHERRSPLERNQKTQNYAETPLVGLFSHA